MVKIDLKSLRKEIERLLKSKNEPILTIGKLVGIKQTVEAVNNDFTIKGAHYKNIQEWNKIKELLDIK